MDVLDEAKDAGIDVWITILPPSEGGNSFPYLDNYTKWAEETAKLSLAYPNLKALAIDDFIYDYDTTFTPSYLGQMRAVANKYNSNLKFIPVIYYHGFSTVTRIAKFEARASYFDAVQFFYRDESSGKANFDSVANFKSEIDKLKTIYKKDIITGIYFKRHGTVGFSSVSYTESLMSLAELYTNGVMVYWADAHNCEETNGTKTTRENREKLNLIKNHFGKMVICDNDKICESGENFENCPEDCKSPIEQWPVSVAASSAFAGKARYLLICKTGDGDTRDNVEVDNVRILDNITGQWINPLSASSYRDTTCNEANILIEDGNNAGLARKSSDTFTAIDIKNVTSCIKADFGKTYDTSKIKIKLKSVNSTCGDSCFGSACNTGGRAYLFYSEDGTNWKYAFTPARYTSLTWEEKDVVGWPAEKIVEYNSMNSCLVNAKPDFPSLEFRCGYWTNNQVISEWKKKDINENATITLEYPTSIYTSSIEITGNELSIVKVEAKNSKDVWETVWEGIAYDDYCFLKINFDRKVFTKTIKITTGAGNWSAIAAVKLTGSNNECNNNGDCDDGNICTTDSCVNYKCQHANNTNSCNDNNLCTITDTCSGGACIGIVKNCDDNLACTIDSCVGGNCQHDTNNCKCNSNNDCNDNNQCTTDTCVNRRCENRNNCSDNQTCSERGECVNSEPINQTQNVTIPVNQTQNITINNNTNTVEVVSTLNNSAVLRINGNEININTGEIKETESSDNNPLFVTLNKINEDGTVEVSLNEVKKSKFYDKFSDYLPVGLGLIAVGIVIFLVVSFLKKPRDIS